MIQSIGHGVRDGLPEALAVPLAAHRLLERAANLAARVGLRELVDYVDDDVVEHDGPALDDDPATDARARQIEQLRDHVLDPGGTGKDAVRQLLLAKGLLGEESSPTG